MKNKVLIPILLILLIVLNACSKRENTVKSKSMQEIYEEKGIPVTVKKIQPQDFKIYLSYNAVLTGYKQSFASAMVGGRIEKINVKTGDYVKKDSVIIEFPLDAPSAQYSQAKAAYELAKITFERMKKIYQAGGISKQKLDQIETQYKVSKANWNSVQQLLKVRAPISGYITALNVHETDNVRQKTILATISQTNKLKTRLWVTEDEILKIKKGMKAEAVWNGIKITGKVTETDLAMNPKHSAFGVNLLFDNSKHLIKSGVIADIKILIYENKEAMIVPANIIKSDEKGKYLFIMKESKASKRYVTIGKGDEQKEIVSGLNFSEYLIIKGSNMVYDNAKVRISK